MTIDHLIAELEQAREDLGGDAEVRIAYQQHYPMRLTVQHLTVPAEHPYADDERAPGQDNDADMVWLACEPPDAPENPYGPSWAWPDDG